MPGNTLVKPNYVNRPFVRQAGKLTFLTGDAAMIQRLKADKKEERASALLLLSDDDTGSEFVGTLESVELLHADRPQQWQVVMTEKHPKTASRS